MNLIIHKKKIPRENIIFIIHQEEVWIRYLKELKQLLLKEKEKN